MFPRRASVYLPAGSDDSVASVDLAALAPGTVAVDAAVILDRNIDRLDLLALVVDQIDVEIGPRIIDRRAGRDPDVAIAFISNGWLNTACGVVAFVSGGRVRCLDSGRCS